jgi:hypothetical protein
MPGRPFVGDKRRLEFCTKELLILVHSRSEGIGSDIEEPDLTGCTIGQWTMRVARLLKSEPLVQIPGYRPVTLVIYERRGNPTSTQSNYKLNKYTLPTSTSDHFCQSQ